MSKSKHPKAKNKTVTPIPQRNRLINTIQMPRSLPSVPASPPPQQHLSAAGEGGSKHNQTKAQDINGKKPKKPTQGKFNE